MNNFIETLRQLGPARLAVMGAVLLGLLLFFVFVSMRLTSPSLELLYGELSTTDSAAMAGQLEQAGILYEITPDGSEIRVSEGDIGRARMLLAQEGLPNGGSMGYELFDQQAGFGTTNFVQNINQVRALEGELARTISSLDSVRTARVHLVLPQRELFSRETPDSTASIFVTLRTGGGASREQILSMQSLVASAVPNLKTGNVSVIDSNGNLLARADGEGEAQLTLKAEEMRRNYEQRLTRSIEDIVGRIVGAGRVRANVTADLNFDRISTNEELYDPAGQVVRSTQTVEESNTEREAASGNVSVENNLPLGGDLLGGDEPSLQSNRLEEVTNFEISRTVRSLIREVGEVKKLSVAVLVDGVYEDVPVEQPAEAEGEEAAEDKEIETQKVYRPRTEEELDQIAALVRSAIGFDSERGDTLEVVNMQFADPGATEEDMGLDLLFGFERSDLLEIGETFAIMIMVVLVIMLVVQPMLGTLLAAEGPSEEDVEAAELLMQANNPALEGPDDSLPAPVAAEEDSLIDMSQVEGKVKASSVKKVADIVEQYPTETVSVIRNWMTQEGS